jgi:predicted Zn finger-like uncharacterized protein
MSSLTRCPACTTVFRVTAWQLEARQGFVRCGQCAKVFDARGSLVPETRDAAPEREVDASAIEAAEIPGIAPAASDALPDRAGAVDAPPDPASIAPRDAPAAPVASAQRVSAPEREVVPAAEEAPATVPFDFGPGHRARSRVATASWLLGILVLIAALAAQAAYWFRTELAVAYPGARPALASACRALGCDIPPPRDARLLSIESSELQVDRNVAGLLTLNATLRNRAPFAQAHPAIELTLTDGDDRPLVRRVLAPAEYLGERWAREPLFAAASEHAVRLHIDATAVRPTGYRLLLFHP